MAISKKDVEYLAYLARLQLDSESLDMLSRQLKDILYYIDKLKKVDTSKVNPTIHPLGLKNVLRKDEPRPSLSKEKVLEGAPSKVDSFFKVIKIIE